MTDEEGWSGWQEGTPDRIGRKRDRLARLLSVASILYSRGSGENGVAVSEIARLTGMTTRTASDFKHGNERINPELGYEVAMWEK